MTTFEFARSPGCTDSEPGTQRWGLTALGLSITSELPLIGAAQRRLVTGDRLVSITRRDGTTPLPSVDADGAVVIAEVRYVDGSLGMRVTHVPQSGYVVDSPSFGTFALSSDGSSIECEQLSPLVWRWHLPLYGQVLPLASTLHGFELLHASVVVLDNRAIVFVAPSGTGKTSLAARLVASGVRPLADDVVALECRDRTVLAHAGVPMANVAREQLEGLRPVERARLGHPVGSRDKIHLMVPNMPPAPVPLGALFFLFRSEKIERLTFELCDPPDPVTLLSATYMPHITEPARLAAQLDLCAQIAASVPTYRLLAPASVSTSDLAAAVERVVAKALA